MADRYRLGRHNNRVIYRQTSSEVDDRDEMIAAVFTAEDAARIVDALNREGYYGRMLWRTPDLLADSEEAP